MEKCLKSMDTQFHRRTKTKLCTLAYLLVDHFNGKRYWRRSGTDFLQGNNFSVSINPESKDEADKLFNGLLVGGEVTMPMADTFWVLILACLLTNSEETGL